MCDKNPLHTLSFLILLRLLVVVTKLFTLASQLNINLTHTFQINRLTLFSQLNPGLYLSGHRKCLLISSLFVYHFLKYLSLEICSLYILAHHCCHYSQQASYLNFRQLTSYLAKAPLSQINLWLANKLVRSLVVRDLSSETKTPSSNRAAGYVLR